MTILSPTRSTTQPAEQLLTAFDVLDIAEAIRNAVAYNATSLNARDRQALALFTYVPQLRGITRMLLSKLANGTAALPLRDVVAMHLLDVHGDDDLLPEPTSDVQEAWLAAHDAAALRRVADGVPWDEDMWIVRGLALRTSGLTGVERAAFQDVSYGHELGICQALVLRQVADRLIAKAPVPTPPHQHTDERPDLAHVPHSITVEPITPGLRRDSGLPAHATLVVVERHAGRLAKVCGTTDVSVADYTEFGHAVTIEALARGIAHTYGATYVEAAAAVNA